MTAATPRSCGACGGQGGKRETTTGSGGATITIWRPCPDCRGRGTR